MGCVMSSLKLCEVDVITIITTQEGSPTNDEKAEAVASLISLPATRHEVEVC